METHFNGHRILRLWSAALFVSLSCMTSNGIAQRAPFGFFVLQGIDKDNVRNSVLRDPSVAGLSIRVSWASLDNGSGYQWQWLDSQVQRCRALGKPYMLRMMAGKDSPTWIEGPWHQGAPLPWSSKAQSALSRAIVELGDRYANDPLLVGVHVSSTANYSSAEMHMAPGLTTYAEYSDSKMIDAWTKAIDSYNAAFPSCAVILNATLEPNHRGAITYPVIAHCQQRLGLRATFQHNSLKASTPMDARHHKMILDLGKNGWRIGFQMTSGSSQDRFGGTFEEALGNAPGASYFEIYQEDAELL
jgi:hypothetical protein